VKERVDASARNAVLHVKEPVAAERIDGLVDNLLALVRARLRATRGQ
jgi:hypothetical protein